MDKRTFKKNNTKLIGLTGTNGSGKGEAAIFFKKNGYDYLSLSDIIRDELRKENHDVSRDNMIKMGNHLRETHGPDILARLAMKKVRGNSVIDSIRNPKEVECLRSQENFVLLAILAPASLRYERVKKRGRDESASSLKEFIEKEAEEMSKGEKEQQLHSCIKMADYKIFNNGSIEDFHKKLEDFL